MTVLTLPNSLLRGGGDKIRSNILLLKNNKIWSILLRIFYGARLIMWLGWGLLFDKYLYLLIYILILIRIYL